LDRTTPNIRIKLQNLLLILNPTRTRGLRHRGKNSAISVVYCTLHSKPIVYLLGAHIGFANYALRY
jgi:hypothetical protein